MCRRLYCELFMGHLGKIVKSFCWMKRICINDIEGITLFWPAILIFMGHLGILLFVWMLCWLSHVIVANILMYALRAGSEDGYLHSFGEKPVSDLLPHGKNWKIHYVVACFYMMITCSLMLPSFSPLCCLVSWYLWYAFNI